MQWFLFLCHSRLRESLSFFVIPSLRGICFGALRIRYFDFRLRLPLSMTKELYFRKPLHLLPVPFYNIEPHRKWTNCKIISIHPRIRRYFIEWTIDNHIFFRFRVFRNTDYFIGMIGSSRRFIVAPARMRERDFHIILILLYTSLF